MAGKTVFVTGGASFIGSTLTDQLLARGAKKVRIVDDPSSGHLDNIRQHLGTAINLGTMERIRVIDCATMVCEFTGHKAEIKLRRDRPTGPLNRVADNSLAKKLLGWEPKVLFREAFKRTIDWYYATRDKEEVKRIFKRLLTER